MLGFLFFISVFTSCHIVKVRLQEDNCENGFNCTRRQQQNLPRCPTGFYCPDGKPTPIPCPEGTFRSMESSSPHKCQACPMNFFNAKLGQASCFPCGSEATQPKEGQNTCLCLRGGRLFQPSDAHCPCAPGYNNPSEDRRWDCVKQRYDICRDGAVRNQEGQCLMREGWANYCKEKVCYRPDDYRSYDKVLGLCLCQTDHLDIVCNLPCRRRQRHILQMACGRELAQLSLSYRNGSQVSILLENIVQVTSLQGLDFHTQKDCTFEENEGFHPVYVVKTNGSGFLGVYHPEPELLHDIFTSNGILSASPSVLPPPASSGTPGQEASRFHHSQLQQASNSLLEMKLTGILNPTVCLSIRDTIMFIVSKDHYPVYDVNNLYNTDREFDWGGFRSLAEDAQLASIGLLLFFYQFHHPGTYVLRLSSNQHKRMYARVMPYGGQCYEEGPFFPTTPRHAVRVGIAQIPDLILKTDWQAVLGIIIGLTSLLLICLLLVTFCPAIGWSRKGSPNPHFRSLQLKYNLSQYSSRESKLVAVRKCHPELQEKGNLENHFSHTEEREGKRGIWDSEEQIDLDSFNTNIFFEILVTQSLAVTAKLSQFKEELKTFYHKLLGEVASLRDLWATRVGVPDRTEPYDEVLMANYTKMKQQAEDEILRRRYLAAEYEESVSRQLRLLSRELKFQEDHFIAFHAALQEAMRLMETLANSLSSGEGPKPDHHRILSLIDAANNQISSIVIKESHRLMLWGILGEGTGAHLIDQVKNRLLTKEELVGKDGSVKEHDLLRLDPTTGLIVPISEVVVLLANQSRKPIFTGHFVHPSTGKLLPIAGNVSFDPASSKLIPVVDLISGEVRHSDIPIFPYIPYPMCCSTGLPVKTNFPILQPENVFKLGGLMPDPASGIEVPILGITIHPQTGQKLSLGGTYVNPLTGTVTPLEIGGPMWASEGEKIVPILGISLERNTGDILPVGSLQDPSGNLLLIGDSFEEPLSGKTGRVHGACFQQDKLVPHAGGYQAVLETNVLMAEIRVAEALREYKDAIWEDLSPVGEEQKALGDAEEDLMGALAQKTDYLLYCLQKLEKQQEWASNLKSTGGKLGMIKYPGTELWIPAVFGMKIPDPGGSDLMVPILGVECDWKTGQAIPLAGTMEDLHGKGLSPIAVGSKTIDPITGETGPVIGAKTNPWTITVVPIVQFLGSLPRGNPDPDLLVALDKERVAKQTYWHGQREKEEVLLKELDFLRVAILDAASQGKMKKLGYRDKMKPTEDISHFLEEDLVQETQRRSSRDLNRLWDAEHSLQMRVEKDERDQEARVHLLVRKALKRLVQFVRRIQLEEGRVQMQLKEAQRQGSRRLQAQEAIQEKAHKIMLNLAAEFQEHTAKQQANVESSHSRLEYLRNLSDRVALQMKELLSGSTQCFINYPGTRFFGAAGAPCGSGEIITRKLIPLLKSVAQMLEEKKRAGSSPEMLLGLGSGAGYSSRSTLKVSEAPSEPLRTETKQDAALAAETLSPVTLFQPEVDTSQVLQEIQARIFLEKHASEMVHLECSLMVEEINMMSCFCESSRLKQTLGMPPHQSMDFAKDWDNLLQELADYHQHSEEDLAQHHWEEAHCMGLNLGEATLKDRVLFSLEEIQQNLALLGASLREADSLFRADAAKENNKTQALEAKPGLVTPKIQAMAVKMVKQEAVKQIWLHRVLDHYKCLFQRWICPEDILQLMRNTCTGENVAREVVQSGEKSLVEKAVAFLQKCDKEGELPLSFWESNNAEWRKLQTQIKTELKEQIEEKLEAKEMKTVWDTSKETTKVPVECGTYYLLSWQHLRQVAFLLEAGVRTPGDESHTGPPILDKPLVDEDTKLIVQLLKEKKELACTLLKLQQVAQILQLREWQFQEMAQKLQAHSSDQPEDAERMAKDLQEFRQKKTKALKDQLQLLLLQRSQETREDPSTDASQLGNARPSLEKYEKETREKGKWEDFQETQLAELENSYKVQILEEKAKLQDWLEKGDIKRWSKEKLMREHDETVTFLDQAFQQEMRKRRGRVEKEGRREHYSQEGGHPPTCRDATLQGQDQISLVKDDQVKSLLAEYIKIMKQTELLVMLRTALLKPRFRSLLSDQKGADGVRSSHLLALLNDVNQELQKYAAAAGFLDSLHPEHDAVNSFQDIMDTQVISSSTTLVPVLPSSLSAREFIVYQYGIVFLQFLQPHVGGPEVDLGIASSIPPSNAPGNAFRNTFYYQIPERKLFVLRESLSCVGSFILLLVHCLAHIAANDHGQDSSPAFRRVFYQALKACLGEMFSLRLQTSAFVEENKSAARMINEAFLKKEVIMDEKINLLSGLCDAKVMPSAGLEKYNQDWLKSQLPPEQKGCYSSIVPDEIQDTVPLESSASESCLPNSPRATDDQEDMLKEMFIKHLEQQVLKGSTCKDQLLSQVGEINLEEDSLLKKTQALEGKVAKAKKA